MLDVKAPTTRARRREQAAQTRDRILDAAWKLFVEHGYEATTMQGIADEAGVAVQTVYFRFGTKAAVLAGVESRAVLGDAQREEWRQTAWARAMGAETDAARLVERFVEANAGVLSRLSPLVKALGAVLPADPDSTAARERGRDEFFGWFVERIESLGRLRDGLAPARALDVVRVLVTVEGYADLIDRRGWSEQEWTDWMTNTLRAQLLA